MQLLCEEYTTVLKAILQNLLYWTISDVYSLLIVITVILQLEYSIK